MSSGFLLDENLPDWWRGAISRLQPHLRVWRIGDPAAPRRRTPDPLILEWCEASDSVLVTNNRHSMPRHLAAHVTQGRHVPGIFIADPAMDINELADELS